MTTLAKLNDRMYIDISKVTYIDVSKHLEVHGPAQTRAKVVVDGHQVVLNDSEVTALLAAMDKAGRL